MTKQLSKLLPAIIVLAVLIVSALLGYVWGAASVEVVDTGLWQLEPSYQGIYVQAVADSYALEPNDALAIERLSFLCQSDSREVVAADGNVATVSSLEAAFLSAEARYGVRNPAKAANLAQLQLLVSDGLVTESAAVPVCNGKSVSGWAGTARLLGPAVLLLMVLGTVAYGVLTHLGIGPFAKEEEARPAATAAATTPAAVRPSPVPTRPGAASPTPAAAPPSSAETMQKPRSGLPAFPGLGKKRPSEEVSPRSAAAAGAALSKTAEKTDFSAIGQEAPLVQFMTTYLHGDDLYDDSFSIETPSGEFLGETGVGISEALGSIGEAKNVTALEVWLFDKNDIRTVTKVLMSDHAFNDDAIRAKLAPKGEAVLARPGDKLYLETATLRVQVRLVDMAYKSDVMPPNGVIDRVTIELAAWKRAASAPRPGSPTGLPGAGRGTPSSGLPSFPG